MKKLSEWFVQLWAESLGKKENDRNETVNVGLTPVAAVGATDQHSQMQLFMEGPKNKVIFFIEVEKFSSDFSLESKLPFPSLEKLSPFTLEQLLKAELKGTLKALNQNDRDYVCIKIPALNARNVGALILWFECLTALTGRLMEINPFDQPGVELGKRYAFEWLNQTQQ